MKQLAGPSVLLFLAACSGGGGAEPSPSASPEVEDTATEFVTETVAATDAAPVAVATPSFDCAKADDKPACVRDQYAMRIHELRRGYADARADDAKGVSKGPLALACNGQDFGVSVTFVNTDPGAVWLAWKDQGVGLAHVVSASGALYEGQNYAGKASLFTKGEDAMLTLPGGTQKTCKIEEIG